jgi:hypothetical protein
MQETSEWNQSSIIPNRPFLLCTLPSAAEQESHSLWQGPGPPHVSCNRRLQPLHKCRSPSVSPQSAQASQSEASLEAASSSSALTSDELPLPISSTLPEPRLGSFFFCCCMQLQKIGSELRSEKGWGGWGMGGVRVTIAMQRTGPPAILVTSHAARTTCADVTRIAFMADSTLILSAAAVAAATASAGGAAAVGGRAAVAVGGGRYLLRVYTQCSSAFRAQRAGWSRSSTHLVICAMALTAAESVTVFRQATRARRQLRPLLLEDDGAALLLHLIATRAATAAGFIVYETAIII